MDSASKQTKSMFDGSAGAFIGYKLSGSSPPSILHSRGEAATGNAVKHFVRSELVRWELVRWELASDGRRFGVLEVRLRP